MGTRHLIAVKVNGEYKVAQYGQWDGYPSGQGIAILRFLRKMDKENFLSKLKQCRFGTEEEFKKIDTSHAHDWEARYPQLSRDTSSVVLDLICESTREFLLSNHITFASDSLMCEYAYVIDFDTNTFEVFKGFNQKPLDESERFAEFPKKGKYHPVRLWEKFDLKGLPTEEEFLKKFELNDE